MTSLNQELSGLTLWISFSMKAILLILLGILILVVGLVGMAQYASALW